MSNEAKRIGRPPTGRVSDAPFTVRLSIEHREAVAAHARRSGVNVTAMVRAWIEQGCPLVVPVLDAA
jgi:predicted HicB family RNase H-like nuclease